MLVKLFFTASESSQAAGQAFAARLAERKDWEPISGPEVALAQIAAFRAWEITDGDRFAKLRNITQPCLVVNGVFDTMIPVKNSYLLAEHLPNAMLLTYPDAGHGSLFQFHESFVRQAALFLDPPASMSTELSLGGIGHNLPQEAPWAFAKAVVNVDGY